MEVICSNYNISYFKLLNGSIHINGGYQLMQFSSQTGPTFPIYNYDMSLFSRYPKPLMKWNGIITVLDPLVWYLLIGSLLVMAVALLITHHIYR